MTVGVSTGRSALDVWRRWPEPVRIAGTAVLGAMIGMITYAIIYYFNPLSPRGPSSWLLAFLIDVPRQHFLHRWLTFNDASAYWPSLARAFVLYAAIAVLTTALDWWMIVDAGLDHRLGWLVCTLATGAVNLFVLKRFVYPVSRTSGGGAG